MWRFTLFLRESTDCEGLSQLWLGRQASTGDPDGGQIYFEIYQRKGLVTRLGCRERRQYIPYEL